jgi:hypothetical protein
VHLAKQQEAPKLEEDPKTAALRMATNTLGPIYYRYIFLKKCHEIREGYATVFISEAELERARQATKRLEDNIKLPGLNLTWLWEEANRRVNAALLRSLPDRATCQVMLRELFQAHQRHHPDAGGVEKDF